MHLTFLLMLINILMSKCDSVLLYSTRVIGFVERLMDGWNSGDEKMILDDI